MEKYSKKLMMFAVLCFSISGNVLADTKPAAKSANVKVTSDNKKVKDDLNSVCEKASSGSCENVITKPQKSPH